MKKIIFLLLISFNAFSQVSLTDSVLIQFPKNNAGEITYSETIGINLTKAAAFKNAQAWVAKNYGNYKSVVQVDDPVSGLLIFKAKSVFSKIDSDIMDAISYTCQIDIKDKKARVTISDLSVYSYVFNREKVEPFAQYYLKQINRKDSYNNVVPEQLRKKDKQVRSLLDEIIESLSINNDF